MINLIICILGVIFCIMSYHPKIDTPFVFIVGMFIIMYGICAQIDSNKEQSQTKLFKPEYQIELLNQNDVRIYNGKTYKTIQFDSIQDYIINDNE